MCNTEANGDMATHRLATGAVRAAQSVGERWERATVAEAIVCLVQCAAEEAVWRFFLSGEIWQRSAMAER